MKTCSNLAIIKLMLERNILVVLSGGYFTWLLRKHKCLLVSNQHGKCVARGCKFRFNEFLFFAWNSFFFLPSWFLFLVAQGWQALGMGCISQNDLWDKRELTNLWINALSRKSWTWNMTGNWRGMPQGLSGDYYRIISSFLDAVKTVLVTTCLQRPHFLFPLKMVSHWNMY